MRDMAKCEFCGKEITIKDTERGRTHYQITKTDKDGKVTVDCQDVWWPDEE
jgi:hypothetical protein